MLSTNTNAYAKLQREQMNGMIAQYEELSTKGNLSADELKILADLPLKTAEAKKNLTEALARDEEMAKLKGFSTSGSGLSPLSNDTVEAAKQAALVDEVKSKVLAATTTWTGKAGHETFGYDAYGKMVPIEGDGWAITTKTLKAISEPAYKEAWNRYVRQGGDRIDRADIKTLSESGVIKTMSEGSDAGGGYLVPPEYMARLIMRKPHPTRIASYVETVPCSSDQVIWPRLNFDSDTADIYSANEPRMQWIGEKGPTPSQPDINFGNVTIQINTGQFYQEVSRNLLEDAEISVAQIIGMLGGQAYDLGIDQVIVAGTGVNQPTGLTTNAGQAGVYCPIVNCGSPVTYQGLINLVEGMPPQYTDSDTTVAVMNKINAWATFAQITDGSGQLIFGLARTQGPEGLASPRVHKLLGYDVAFSPFWPNTGAGALPLGFGDLKETYILAQRVGLTIETYGTQDKGMLLGNKLGWLFRFRLGGQVVQSRAFHCGSQS